jgi:hypothetical protein
VTTALLPKGNWIHIPFSVTPEQSGCRASKHDGRHQKFGWSNAVDAE